MANRSAISASIWAAISLMMRLPQTLAVTCPPALRRYWHRKRARQSAFELYWREQHAVWHRADADPARRHRPERGLHLTAKFPEHRADAGAERQLQCQRHAFSSGQFLLSRRHTE